MGKRIDTILFLQVPKNFQIFSHGELDMLEGRICGRRGEQQHNS